MRATQTQRKFYIENWYGFNNCKGKILSLNYGYYVKNIVKILYFLCNPWLLSYIVILHINFSVWRLCTVMSVANISRAHHARKVRKLSTTTRIIVSNHLWSHSRIHRFDESRFASNSFFISDLRNENDKTRYSLRTY